MEERDQAFRALAAVAATGWASGRVVALFFAQTGAAAWLGVAVSSATFGLFVGLLARWAVRCGADGFSRLCARALPAWAGRAVRGMRAVLLTATAILALHWAGTLGALTLPTPNARLCGALLALLAALLLNLFDRRPLAWAGLAALALGVLYYVALALDPRPARVHATGDVALALWNSVPAAALLGLLHGAMNAGIAADAAARQRACPHPARFGAACAGAMAVALGCANAAILRGGREVVAQPLPTVLLSARWGIAGFWLCAGYGFLCAACALGGIISGVMPARLRRSFSG